MSKRILVVEDDQELSHLLVRALGAKYEVITAKDGLEGWLKATSEPAPDLVIADIGMPKLDGLEMVRRIKKHDEAWRIPIIFLTAHGQPKDIVEGINVGARQYLTKPVQIATLLEKVGQILGET